jgi:hypothetical protein
MNHVPLQLFDMAAFPEVALQYPQGIEVGSPCLQTKKS